MPGGSTYIRINNIKRSAKTVEIFEITWIIYRVHNTNGHLLFCILGYEEFTSILI